MLEFYERRKLKRLLYSWPAVFVLLLIFLFLAQNVWDVFVTERNTIDKRTERATVLENLEGRKAVLESQIDKLNTERGLEEEIRNKFEVSKEGESVIVLLDKKEEEVKIEKKKGLFWWIVDLF